jgi:hypothetical protein
MMVGVPINHYQPLLVFHGMGIGTLNNTWLNMLLSLADTVHVCHYDIHIHELCMLHKLYNLLNFWLLFALPKQQKIGAAKLAALRCCFQFCAPSLL